MHLRFEVPYMPLEQSVSNLSWLTGTQKERLQKLDLQNLQIPRTLSSELVKHAGRGKYCIIAFATEADQDMPVGFAACAIIKTGREDEWGFITDLVVDRPYRKKKVASRLVTEMMNRLQEPSVLSLACIKEGSLRFIRVAISSQLTTCQKVFAGCGFELVRGNGENIYEYSLTSSNPEEVMIAPPQKK